MENRTPELVTRDVAFKSGKKRFFTGQPCGEGHIAERYVSNGGCIECVNPYRQRRHAIDPTLVPYVCPKFWTRRGLTPENYDQLQEYLQRCIDTYCAAVFPGEPAPMHEAPAQTLRERVDE